jgi:hypothetical protein
MNRFKLHNDGKQDKFINPLHRPARQMRRQTEECLRDIAYVLQLTRQVKDQILVSDTRRSADYGIA